MILRTKKEIGNTKKIYCEEIQEKCSSSLKEFISFSRN